MVPLALAAAGGNTAIMQPILDRFRELETAEAYRKCFPLNGDEEEEVMNGDSKWGYSQHGFWQECQSLSLDDGQRQRGYRWINLV